MNSHFFQCAARLACGGLLFAPVLAQDALRSLDPLYVRADRPGMPMAGTAQVLGDTSLRTADAAALVRDLPGAAIVRNGPQTGIVQLRGLSGDRVAVRVDGMAITPACPNHMDPPLHYASPAADDLLQVFAGISPVSAGGDQIGGALTIASPAPRFAEKDARLLTGALGASFLGSQDALRLQADATAANADLSVRYRGAAATADDLRFPDGRVSDTGYELMQHGLSGAWRTAGGFIALDVGMANTRDAGTPALPMDMIEDDAWNVGITQQENFHWGTLESRLYLHDIEHLMDNFTLRTPPTPPAGMAMEAPSASRDYGWRADATVPIAENKLRAGIDLHRNEFEAEQVAVGMGTRRDTFNDNVRSRAGLYVDWEQQHSAQWTSRIGLRGDVVASDADAVSNAILPPPGSMRDMILADQARFNAADRSFNDVLPAATAALRYMPDEQTGIELALALKSRAPSLVERYLWTPLNASAGLADGRTYLGNLDLDPETSLQAALAVTRKGDSWYAGVTPFYQSVADYIQGMPIARNDMNGKPVLQYQNIDRAELYGVDLTGGYDFGHGIALDSTISYVRGRNRDGGGDLYRIAPLRGMFDLSHRAGAWESHLEWMWADAQNKVATLQDETASPGYGIINLRVARTFAEKVRVELGVENLFDKLYADHLSGVNRVGGGDVAVGERIPSAGRFGYFAVSWEF